jgi:hypothetical protein
MIPSDTTVRTGRTDPVLQATDFTDFTDAVFLKI